MTARKHLKQLIRSRMAKTGERYAAARRCVITNAPPAGRDPATQWHFAGDIATATALRTLLAHAGVRNPNTGEPLSEAMLFGLGGGIGAGVFSFFYEKENIATFYVAGRHSWWDEAAGFKETLGRFGIKPLIQESGGAKLADKQLRTALAENGPCIAWVDMAHLPHRAMPAHWSGGGYHVVTVYRIDDESGTAIIGDLTDEPISIPLDALAQARARIKKQKNRVLSVPAGASSPSDLKPLVRDALKACHQGLTKQRMKNFTLDAFRVWGERMHGSKDKESWERIFKPGPNLLRGLVSIYDFIEHYGTGGGLCRAIFDDFLKETATATKNSSLKELGGRYAALGRRWSELAHAALPDDVPAFAEARELHARKAELIHDGASPQEVRAAWEQIAEREQRIGGKFPLTETESADLRKQLQPMILALHADEMAAHEAMGQAVQSM